MPALRLTLALSALVALSGVLLCLPRGAQAAQAVAAGPGGALSKRPAPAEKEGGRPQVNGELVQLDLLHGCDSKDDGVTDYLHCSFAHLEKEVAEVQQAAWDGKRIADSALASGDGSESVAVLVEVDAVRKEAKDVKIMTDRIRNYLLHGNPSLAETADAHLDRVDRVTHVLNQAYVDSQFDKMNADSLKIGTTVSSVKATLLDVFMTNPKAVPAGTQHRVETELAKIDADTQTVIDTAKNFAHALSPGSSLLMRREVQTSE